MKAWMLAATTGLAALCAGCATNDMAGPAAPGEGAMCDAEGAQGFVGQKATAEAGQELLRATGARQLRWGPPRSAMTMDFRPDRLTVSYDDNMVIERVGCN